MPTVVYFDEKGAQQSVYESLVINEFIEELAGRPVLLPADPAARAKVGAAGLDGGGLRAGGLERAGGRLCRALAGAASCQQGAARRTPRHARVVCLAAPAQVRVMTNAVDKLLEQTVDKLTFAKLDECGPPAEELNKQLKWLNDNIQVRCRGRAGRWRAPGRPGT